MCAFIVSSGLGEWLIPGEKFLFYQKPLSDWGTLIYRWAKDSGRFNSIETLFSLMDEIPSDILESAPIDLIYRVLISLEKLGKCEIVGDTTSPSLERLGVKFFS